MSSTATGLELADEDRRGRVPEPAVHPADAADVKQRERCQADPSSIEAPARRGRRGRGEVAMRGQHALRHSGRAGGVHLHDHVRRLSASAGVDRVVRGQPRLVGVRPRRGRPSAARSGSPAPPSDAVRSRDRRCRRSATARPRWRARRAVPGREPPVERHDHRADLRRGDQQLDHLRSRRVRGTRRVRRPRCRGRAAPARAGWSARPTPRRSSRSPCRSATASGRDAAARRMTSATRTSALAAISSRGVRSEVIGVRGNCESTLSHTFTVRDASHRFGLDTPLDLF